MLRAVAVIADGRQPPAMSLRAMPAADLNVRPRHATPLPLCAVTRHGVAVVAAMMLGYAVAMIYAPRLIFAPMSPIFFAA